MGNIGTLSSIGKTGNSGGGSGLTLKKIYQDEDGSYISCFLPSSVQSVTDLINYMIIDCPHIIKYNDSGVSRTWYKVTDIPCSGIYTYTQFYGLEPYYVIYSVQQYVSSTDLPIDYTQFPVPTSLTVLVYRVYHTDTQKYTIDNTWSIIDI